MEGELSSHVPSEPRWLKPSPGWVELNWDAALCSSTKLMGVGVVGQNEKGEFIAGLAAPIPFVIDPLLAEILAAWRAVELGREMGYQQMVLEGDSLATVAAIN
jgi:hypothetical protein